MTRQHLDISPYIRSLAPIDAAVHPQGRLPGDIHGIMFDIYGTLFISGCGDIGVSQETAARPQRIDALRQKYHINLDAQTLQERLFGAIKAAHRQMKAEGIGHPEVQIDRIWSSVLAEKDMEKVRCFAIEYEWLVNPVFPMPHLMQILDYCRSASLKTGLISNAQFFTPYLFPWLLGQDVIQLGFSPELLFYSYQIGHAKPSTVLFAKAAAALEKRGLSAGQVLYVGNDMLNDIWPAQLSGFKTALFAGDRRSLRMREDDERCRQIRPDIVITDLLQIKDFVTCPQ